MSGRRNHPLAPDPKQSPLTRALRGRPLAQGRKFTSPDAL